MKKFLIASHGHLASGIKSLATVAICANSTITALDCYVDDANSAVAHPASSMYSASTAGPAATIKEWIDSVSPEDNAVIFTDLLGGSMCNIVKVLQPEKHGVIHITGFNATLVLELLLAQEVITPEFVDATIAAVQPTMRRVAMDEEDMATLESEDYSTLFS